MILIFALIAAAVVLAAAATLYYVFRAIGLASILATIGITMILAGAGVIAPIFTIAALTALTIILTVSIVLGDRMGIAAGKIGSAATVLLLVVGAAMAVNATNTSGSLHYNGIIEKNTDGSFSAAPEGTGTQDGEGQLINTVAYATSNFCETGLTGITERDKAASLLDCAATRPFMLATSAAEVVDENGNRLWDNPNNVAPLISPDGKHLSKEGRELHGKLTNFYNTAELSFSEADQNAVNTGVSEFGVSSSQGVSGADRLTLVAVSKTMRVETLVRCGNRVFPEGSGPAPSGHTDSYPPRTPGKPWKPPTKPPVPPTTTTTTVPPTTTTTTVPPTTTTTTVPPTTTTTTVPPTTTVPTCPPGTTGTPPDCLEVKPSDPNEYPHITDAPQATVTGPAATPTVPDQPAGTTEPGVSIPDDGADGPILAPDAGTTEPQETPAPIITQAPAETEAPNTDVDPDAGAALEPAPHEADQVPAAEVEVENSTFSTSTDNRPALLGALALLAVIVAIAGIVRYKKD